MVVWVNVYGTLQNYFRENHFPVTLSEDGVVKDLFLAIESHSEQILPEHIWDRENHCFHGSVLVIVDGIDLHDHSTKLVDGQEVALITPVHGG